MEKIFAWCRSAVLYAMLFLMSEHFLQKDYSISGTWLADAATIIIIVLAGIYVAAVIVSMVMAKKGKRNGYDRSNDVSVVTSIVYLLDDFFRPFKETVKSLVKIFTYSQCKSPAVLIGSIIGFIAYAALAAAFVLFGLSLIVYIVWIGL